MFLKKLFAALIVVFAFSSSSFCFSQPSRKPLSPLAITITPVQPGITPDQIKPGEVIDFKVTAVSRIDVQEMWINIELAGGAKKISGETSWTGPAVKNEEKSIVISVQAPGQGKGRIKARASLPPSDGTRFSVETHFVLGPAAKTKPGKGTVTRDSKGKSIIEYR